MPTIKNTTTGETYDSGLPRIETRQSQLWEKNNQLQRSILLYKNARNLSILSPDEDWQYAVETLWCTS